MSLKLFSFIILAAFITGTVAAALVISNNNQPALTRASQEGSITTQTFEEDFTDDILKASGVTTANWDTTYRQLKLNTTSGGFYKADGITAGFDSVSDLAGNSTTSTRSIAYDINQNPVMVWQDCTGFFCAPDIRVAHWTGTTWTGYYDVDPDSNPATYDSDNISNNVGQSISPRLILDSQDRPIVLWQDYTSGSAEVYVSRWNGTTWTDATGVDADANPATFEFDNVSNNANTDRNIHIAIDSSDQMALFWVEDISGGKQLHYTQWNGSTWTGADLTDSDENPNTFESDIILLASDPAFTHGGTLSIDNSGRPAVTFLYAPTSFGSEDTFFSTWNGSSWTGADLVDDDGNANTNDYDNLSNSAEFTNAPASIAYDEDENPVVVWMEDNTPIDVVITHWTGTTWTGYYNVNPDNNPATYEFDDVNDDVSSAASPTVVMDNARFPVIAWSTGSPGDVVISRWNGSTYTGLSRIDADGNPATFEATQVNDTAENSFNTSFLLDPYANPMLAWTDTVNPATDNQVYFTRWIEPCAATGSAESLTIDATDGNIAQATLSAEYLTNGGSIVFALSNDGGATFETVTPESPHTFSTAGSDLRWKAVLNSQTGSSKANCPLINNLSVTYSSQAATRITGDDQIDLAIEVSKQAFPTDSSAPVVVLARSDNLIDEFVGTPLVSQSTASLLLTPPNQLDPRTLAEIQRVLAPGGTIYVLGQTEAITPAVIEELNTNGFSTITRLGGPRRHETAIEIFRELERLTGGPLANAFLTEDSFLVDSFVIGPVAGDKTDGSIDGILITERANNQLNESTEQFLKDTASTLETLTIVGGTAAVSSSAGEQAQATAASATTTRVAGADRYVTNQLVNDAYFQSPGTAIIANGQGPNIPGSVAVTSGGQGTGLFSALLAGSFATTFPAPLILTTVDELPAPALEYLTAHASSIDGVYVVGNTFDVSDAVVLEIQDLL